MTVKYKPSVLCISASDSLGLSGMQADLRAIESMNVHGACVVTATTAQNQQTFLSLNEVSDQAFESQLDALYQQDIFSVIKIGLIANEQQVKILINHAIFKHKKIILDPVLAATAGNIENSNSRLRGIKLLLPFVTLLTPNVQEVKALLNLKDKVLDIKKSAMALLALGVESVLIKGGHGEVIGQDYFYNTEHCFFIKQEPLDSSYSRGTGCAMASIVAAALANGASIMDAVVMAKMQIAAGFKQKFKIDSSSGSLLFPKWCHHLDYSAQQELEVALPQLYKNPEECEYRFAPCDGPLGLYPVVDRAHWLETLLPLGINIIQLRIKDLTADALKQEIEKAALISQKYNCKLYINDYWQLAIECDAYGVHLGQEDIDDADLCAIAKAGLRLGLSSHCFYEVARAKTLKPSYIAFGPVYSTQSKDMPWVPQGPQGLHYWRQHLPNVPIVAIGGIEGDRFEVVKQTGVDAIAMISAITLAHEPKAAALNYIHSFNSLP